MYIHCFLLPLCIEVELYVVNFIANVFVNMQMLLYGMNTITVNIQNYKCYFTEWIQLQRISKTTNTLECSVGKKVNNILILND